MVYVIFNKKYISEYDRVLKIIIKNCIAALFSINRNKNCLM